MAEKLTKKMVDERVMEIVMQQSGGNNTPLNAGPPNIAQDLLNRVKAKRNGGDANNNQAV